MLQREKAYYLEGSRPNTHRELQSLPLTIFFFFAFKYELLNLKYKAQVIFNKNPQNRRKM